jgi:uncharacterized protein (DUF2267 family)
VNYQQFLAEVQELSRLRTSDEAESVVANVFMAIAEVLPQRNVEDLASALPPELMVYLRGAHEEPDPYFDDHLFLGWVVSTIDSTGERDKTVGGLDIYADYSGEEAMRRCSSVFSALKPLIEDSHRELLESCLPQGISQVFVEA